MAVKTNVVGGGTLQGGTLVPFVADTGPQGLSAYQLWLQAGNTGTEAQYMASLKSNAAGPAGAAGAKGWSPVFGGELDATRTLLRVVDWTGGEGTKPDTGMYVGPVGYVTTKAAAFNFNATKRVMVLSAVTNASGVATFDFTTLGFANAPAAIALPATTTVLSGATRSTVGAVTKTGATVTVQTQAVLTGLVSFLVGATANLLVIEV